MKMIEVSSSNIASVGYNPIALELFVKFKNGRTFSYKHVAPWEHNDMLNSDSVGKHFNKLIKPGRIAVEIKAEKEPSENELKERLDSALAHLMMIDKIVANSPMNADIAALTKAALDIDEAKSNV